MQQALMNAEENLRSFYERNHTWQQSPQLSFEESRLKRQLEIQQDLYVTLRREYETARIEEVNDIPVITVIDPAVAPQRRSWPKRLLLTVLAAILGTLVSVVWTFGAHHLARAQQESAPDYLAFRDALIRARQELGRILHPHSSHAVD